MNLGGLTDLPFFWSFVELKKFVGALTIVMRKLSAVRPYGLNHLKIAAMV
ncbi:MAG: hypothetical protein F6K15_01375 [Okeania sp. SIO2B3]|nr:hypothetical protein [Okeania sp. SIO2B3]